LSFIEIDVSVWFFPAEEINVKLLIIYFLTKVSIHMAARVLNHTHFKLVTVSVNVRVRHTVRLTVRITS